MIFYFSRFKVRWVSLQFTKKKVCLNNLQVNHFYQKIRKHEMFDNSFLRIQNVIVLSSIIPKHIFSYIHGCCCGHLKLAVLLSCGLSDVCSGVEYFVCFCGVLCVLLVCLFFFQWICNAQQMYMTSNENNLNKMQ